MKPSPSRSLCQRGPHLAVTSGDKRLGLSDVVSLSTGEAQRQRIAQGVDNDMNFGGQPAARTTYGLVETPSFFEPRRCAGGL